MCIFGNIFFPFSICLPNPTLTPAEQIQKNVGPLADFKLCGCCVLLSEYTLLTEDSIFSHFPQCGAAVHHIFLLVVLFSFCRLTLYCYVVYSVLSFYITIKIFFKNCRLEVILLDHNSFKYHLFICFVLLNTPSNCMSSQR